MMNSNGCLEGYLEQKALNHWQLLETEGFNFTR
jgi:hypothetical protein